MSRPILTLVMKDGTAYDLFRGGDLFPTPTPLAIFDKTNKALVSEILAQIAEIDSSNEVKIADSDESWQASEALLRANGH